MLLPGLHLAYNALFLNSYHKKRSFMSDEHSSLIKTPKQLAIVVVASFFVPIILIMMIVQIVTGNTRLETSDPRMSAEAIAQRLQPVGQVVVVDLNAPRAEKNGEQIFNAACIACHGSGALGAPKVGDKAGWGKRIAKGLDVMTKLAIKGIGQMPPRGGNAELTDIEIKRAVAYMANKSGASFKEPEIKVVAPAPAQTNVKIKTESVAVVAPQTNAAPAVAKNEPVNKGKSVYDAACVACHASGLAGAPKAGDKSAWAPRIKTGLAALYNSALKGKGTMPPKAGRTDLPDTDIKAAVDYLVTLAK